MIKTVGVKNLMFHFYNDLLFLKFTVWIVKEMKEFEFQYFPCSATTLPNAEFICRQFSFSSFCDPKKEKCEDYFFLLFLFTGLGETLNPNRRFGPVKSMSAVQ